MIDVTPFQATTHAFLLVGLVLFEAVVLYTGYGLVEQRAAPRVLETIEQS